MHWIIQIVFDILLLLFFLSVLRSKAGRHDDERTNVVEDDSRQQEQLSQLEDLRDLQDALESLVIQVERTTNESFEKVQRLIDQAKESTIALEEQVEVARSVNQSRLAERLTESPEMPENESDMEETKAQTILRLYREDIDVEQIARQMGIGRGEVQLVLDLNRSEKEKKDK